MGVWCLESLCVQHLTWTWDASGTEGISPVGPRAQGVKDRGAGEGVDRCVWDCNQGQSRSLKQVRSEV